MAELTRRELLTQSLASAGAMLAAQSLGGLARSGQPAAKKLPVAAVVTVYHRNSHADVIVGKILEGFQQDGGPGPQLELVSLYTDQVPDTDMSRDLAAKHGFRLAGSIEEALTLGGPKLAVAGVLNIGEHGDYPAVPQTGQVMYPRRRFFDEVVATFRRYGQVAPLFNDKHLGYQWDDAKFMVDTARDLGIPFLAGSSAPVAWRSPPLALPLECEIEEAVAVGYGGLESYGFHALELLQCMVERRQGGETGVRSVESVQGDAIWKAERERRWSRKLLQAALATLPGVETDRMEEKLQEGAAFYLIEYRDGLKATVAMANGLAAEFAFAARLKERPDPVATWLQLQDAAPFGHFAYLLKAIEHTVHTGRAAYPVERTLLTTGVLDAAMHSLAGGPSRVETPHLDIAYQPVDWPFAPGSPPGL